MLNQHESISSILSRSTIYRASSRTAAAALVAAAFLAFDASGSKLFAQDNKKTVTAVMSARLGALDPVINLTAITRYYGYMVYDVLVAPDANGVPQPQMADWTVSDDKLTYTFKLREGLKFHDGTPVTSEDAIASLRRWGTKPTPNGPLIFRVTKELKAIDDRTIVWSLSEPFALFLDIVGQDNNPPFVMPARVANASPDTAVTDHTGSGPFVFVDEEYQHNISATFRKFTDYIPREEPASASAGGKVVKVDEVKWVNMPDFQTAVNALSAGEVNYIERVPSDLLPLAQAAPGVVTEVRLPFSQQLQARVNFKYPPFDNVKIRQAALKALSQEEALALAIGNPEYTRTCGAIFGCDSRFASTSGSESLTSNGDIEGAKALLKEAGYDGSPIVVLQPDHYYGGPLSAYVASALRKVGFNVDLQSSDTQSWVARLGNSKPPAEGGWNVFATGTDVASLSLPLKHPYAHGRGDNDTWGWPVDADVEALHDKFIAAKSEEEQIEVADEIQRHSMETVLYMPLGEFSNVQARSEKLSGMIAATMPLFWNVELTVD